MQTIPSGKHLENIQCNKSAFPEFPDLLFGSSIDNRTQYFDATDYLKKQKLTTTAEDFLREYNHPVNTLISAYELDIDKVCVLNGEGHTLLDSNLVYLFISFIHPDFLAHLNDRIHELFTAGFCVSDTYLYGATKLRLSPEIFNREDGGSPQS